MHGQGLTGCNQPSATGAGTCTIGHTNPSAKEKALLDLKARVANDYQGVRLGKVTVSQFDLDLRAYEANLPASYASHGARIVVHPYCISEPGGGCAPSYAHVNLTQQPQANWYYCGPAAASEILNALGANYSQSFVAGSPNYPGTYLTTAYNGQTPWSPYVMGPTLNNLQSKLYYATQPGSGVQLSQWENDLVTDVSGYGQPIAGNTVENYNNGNGPFLTGHQYAPGSAFPLGHWIAIYGYTNYGQGSTYADSISGDQWIWSWAANVPPYSTINSSDMNTLLQTMGFVW